MERDQLHNLQGLVLNENTRPLVQKVGEHHIPGYRQETEEQWSASFICSTIFAWPSTVCRLHDVHWGPGPEHSGGATR